MMTTTLSKIWTAKPCVTGWNKLNAALGDDFDTFANFPIAKILETNDLMDAAWALRTILDEYDFAPMCKELLELGVDIVTTDTTLRKAIREIISDPGTTDEMDLISLTLGISSLFDESYQRQYFYAIRDCAKSITGFSVYKVVHALACLINESTDLDYVVEIEPVFLKYINQ
jgi:transcription elongation factor GreA-like protein